MRHDAPAAHAAASALIAEHGTDVLPQVMLAWIDTALAAMGVARDGRPAQLVFADVSTGRCATDAADVSPTVAWAGRLLNARIADDEDSFRALLDAVPDGQSGVYVNALLDCCAQSVRLGPHLAAATRGDRTEGTA
jgi:hypothetical protein